MNRIAAVVNLGVSGYFLYTIVRHMMRPGMNTGYTRVLMFACLATIPMIFMTGAIGGRDRLPFLLDHARRIASSGPYSWLTIAGLGVITILLPLVIFVSLWFWMELRSAVLFTLFFIPLLMRMALTTSRECLVTAVAQAMLFLLTAPIGALIATYLERHASGVAVYERHVHTIWPGYETAANMFFWVCTFALVNQLIEFLRALIALLRKSW